ncbi:MAG: DUF1152 domain-containing protein [Candidatus Jordarchaeum sp.]|uniref:DUF1152 domain-containing protein n=1 Tax=Candidatus Jordarchaeum sp. TaxID=2823881 RepID=UPI00404AD897
MLESIEKLASKINRALIIGVGGGGDILGTLPTSNYLNILGVETILGGVSWERIVFDPKPGPRSLDDVENIEKISECTAFIDKNSRTRDGVYFQCSNMAKYLKQRTIMVDVSKGVRDISRGLQETVKKLKLDLIVGLDVGGDILASSRESGLRSPLCDGMMLTSLRFLKIPTIIAVFAPGCDGELTLDELVKRFQLAASNSGYLGARGMTPDDFYKMSEAVRYVKTEASFLPLRAWKGKHGIFKIRNGNRSVELSIFSTLTFYFDTKVVYDLSPIGKALKNTKNFQESNQRLHELNLMTEYDFELNYVKNRKKTDFQ